MGTRNLCCRLLLCVLILLAGGHLAHADGLAGVPRASGMVIDGDAAGVWLGPYVHYVNAAPDALTPEALLARPHEWQSNTTLAVNLGYQPEPVWFAVAFDVSAGLESDWILELANPHLDDVTVFLYVGDQLLHRWQVGDRLPFRERVIESRNFLFPLQLQPDQQYRLFLLAHSTEAMELPLVLYPQSAYAELSNRRAMIDGVFYGIMLIMAAYSLALYLILLDRAYVFYVSYVTSMLLFFLWQQGVWYQHFFPAYPALQHYGAGVLSLLIFTSIAFFFNTFLELWKKVPRIWLLYKALLMLHGILCLSLWVLNYQTVILLMVVNTVLSTLVAVVSIVHLALKGARSAQIVLAGWTLFLFCLMFFTAAKTGVIYNDFMADYGLRLGISFEILIFSFALSFRINQERKAKEQALSQVSLERSERLRAQELALQNETEARQAKEAALQLEIQHNEKLQQQVEERTADLERILINLEHANRELERLSALDSLTGVYNRRIFNEKLQESWQVLQRQSQPLSIVLLDLDHFKHINDSKGHQCGDYVLREFAALLKRLLHRPSDVVTRYGGEEFAIILPDTPVAGAEVVAGSIVRHASNHVYVWEDEVFHVTVSIGIDSRIASPDGTADSLIACADSALYQAKAQGRNRWVTYRREGAGGEGLTT